MANDRPRNTQGRYEPEYDDEEFLEAVREHAPAGTQEVADAVGVTRPSATYRLKQLEETGDVQRKKIGARAVVWWLADTDMEDTADADTEGRLKRLSNELDEAITVGEQVYESGDAHTLDDHEHDAEGQFARPLTDDRTAVDERDAEDIIADLEAFIEETDATELPLPSADAVRDDYHAHRHRENLECLANDDE